MFTHRPPRSTFELLCEPKRGREGLFAHEGGDRCRPSTMVRTEVQTRWRHGLVWQSRCRSDFDVGLNRGGGLALLLLAEPSLVRFIRAAFGSATLEVGCQPGRELESLSGKVQRNEARCCTP
jgi:hypothetical protein